MPKPLALGVLAVGILLLIFGFNSSDAFASEVSEVVDGTPTEDSMWLLAGGALLTVVGGAALLRRR